MLKKQKKRSFSNFFRDLLLYVLERILIQKSRIFSLFFVCFCFNNNNNACLTFSIPGFLKFSPGRLIRFSRRRDIFSHSQNPPTFESTFSKICFLNFKEIKFKNKHLCDVSNSVHSECLLSLPIPYQFLCTIFCFSASRDF